MAIISLMGNDIYDPILDCQSSFEPCEYLYFSTTIIHRQNDFLIVHSENDDCGDQYKKASIGLLLFVILWT